MIARCINDLKYTDTVLQDIIMLTTATSSYMKGFGVLWLYLPNSLNKIENRSLPS